MMTDDASLCPGEPTAPHRTAHRAHTSPLTETDIPLRDGRCAWRSGPRDADGEPWQGDKRIASLPSVGAGAAAGEQQ